MHHNFVVSLLKVRLYFVPPCRSLTGAHKDVSDSLEMERKERSGQQVAVGRIEMQAGREGEKNDFLISFRRLRIRIKKQLLRARDLAYVGPGGGSDRWRCHANEITISRKAPRFRT